MLEDILLLLLMAIIVTGIMILFYIDNIKCKHTWEQHGCEIYDNRIKGTRKACCLVCTKCGKVKVIK